MKRATSILTILTVLVLVAMPVFSDPQVSRVLTFTTGTAQRIAPNRVIVNSLFIQMRAGGTNLGYVLWAPPEATCSKGTAGHVVAELTPASATTPGGSFSFSVNSGAPSNGFDVQNFCVEGTTSETAIVSYNVRN